MIQYILDKSIYNKTGSEWVAIPTDKKGNYCLQVLPTCYGLQSIILHKSGKTWTATLINTGLALKSGMRTKAELKEEIESILSRWSTEGRIQQLQKRAAEAMEYYTIGTKNLP
jgi:hypothetical protein